VQEFPRALDVIIEIGRIIMVSLTLTKTTDSRILAWQMEDRNSTIATLTSRTEGSKRWALLTANVLFSTTTGKSLRLVRIANLLNSQGLNVMLAVSASETMNLGDRIIPICTASGKSDTSLASPLQKGFHFLQQISRLSAFYLRLVFLPVEFDVIVTSLVSPSVDSFLALLLCKVKGAHFVYDYDDPSPETIMLVSNCPKNDPRVVIDSLMQKILMGNADLVVTSAPTLANQAITKYKARVACVFYNIPSEECFHAKRDRDALRRRLGLSDRGLVLCYLGDPQPKVRGLEKLIHTLAELKDSVKVTLVIVGGGPWEGPFRALVAAEKLEDCVMLTGRKSREEALDFLAASDVSCIPYEVSPAAIHQVPTKLFESMALGIPVLCTRVPNFMSILGEDGIYFDGTGPDLKEKLEWIVSEKSQLTSRGLRLKSRLETNFEHSNSAAGLGKELGHLLEHDNNR